MAFVPESELQHPEQREGEVWYTNLPKNDRHILYGAGFDSIPYKSKRKGELAFDILGKPIESCYPVFVSIEEWKQSQEGL